MKTALLAFLLVAQTLFAAEARNPNVLFVALDDLKPAIGCYGDPLAKTPNIDRLAARGTLFERAYCMQAVCAPSRNAMLTGLRPEVLKIYDLGTNFRRRTPDVATLPQWFKDHGYASHGVGKIFHVGHGNHEDPASWSVPHYQGKTVSYALPENRMSTTREEALFENEQVDVGKLPRGVAYESADVSDDTYSDGMIANEAVSRLRKFKETGEAFFLAVGFLRPHLPFCSPKRYWDLYDPKTFKLPARTTAPDGAPEFAPQYGGEIRQYANVPDKGPLPEDLQRNLIHGYYAAASYADAQFGRVLDELDRLGLAENTVIVLWGDHGWHLGDHGMWCKHTDYEQATRAPLLIAAPGKRAGQRVHALVEFVDVYPTLCDLAGIEKPSHVQGESLVPLLNAPESMGRPAAFQVYPRNAPGVGPVLGHAVRTDRWRYVEWRRSDQTPIAWELYDMEKDPDETVNLAERTEFAPVVAEHAKLLEAKLAQPVPPNLKLLDLSSSAPKAVDRDALFDKKDKNHDGKLTRKEFLADQPDPSEALKRFSRFDTNGDGELSREEFVKAGAK